MTGWAILGTGGASARVAASIRASRGASELVTVASRDQSRARHFAHRWGGSAVGWADAVADRRVEAVYVATPPSLHEAHALLAIEAGKAVLVEKPFAMDAASAERIMAAAQAAGVFCMEALWTRFLPMISQVAEWLSAERIGEPRSLTASFMVAERVDASRSIFDASRGGGSLMHRGVYLVSLARMLLGPAVVAAAASRQGGTGVDEESAVVLRHENGALSTLMASLRAAGPNRLTVGGTEGMIELLPPVYRPDRAQLVLARPRSGPSSGSGDGLRARVANLPGIHWTWQRASRLPVRRRTEFRPYRGNGYAHEIAEVEECLATGARESRVMPLAESVQVMRLIDEARAMAALGPWP